VYFIDLGLSHTTFTHTSLNNVQKISILDSSLWYRKM